MGKSNNEQNKMAVMPMNTLLVSMSVPLMLSLLVQSLYNIVDSIFVSRYSEQTLTATSLVYAIQFLMIAVGVGTNVGLNSLLSRYVGAKKNEDACRAATTGLILNIISALIFSLVGIFFAKPIAGLMTSDPELKELCIQYMQVCVIFCYGTFIQTYGQRLLQAVGDTILSMVSVFCLVFFRTAPPVFSSYANCLFTNYYTRRFLFVNRKFSIIPEFFYHTADPQQSLCVFCSQKVYEPGGLLPFFLSPLPHTLPSQVGQLHAHTPAVTRRRLSDNEPVFFQFIENRRYTRGSDVHVIAQIPRGSLPLVLVQIIEYHPPPGIGFSGTLSFLAHAHFPDCVRNFFNQLLSVHLSLLLPFVITLSGYSPVAFGHFSVTLWSLP